MPTIKTKILGSVAAVALGVVLAISASSSLAGQMVTPTPAPRHEGQSAVSPPATIPAPAAVPAQPIVIDGKSGYVVIDISSGKVLAAKEAREGFIPASVAKLPAALVILDRLGPFHQFTTTVQTNGVIEKGVLKGDLILVGGADPALMHQDIEALVDTLKKNGIKRVEGAFYYDASALATIAEIEPRQPDTAAYNPPLGGLSVDFSRFSVVWKKAKDGTIGPAVGAEVPLSVLPVKLPTQIPPSNQMWLPVVDAGNFAAQVFAHYAKAKGLNLPVPTPVPEILRGHAGTILAAHQSAPLSEILRDAMYYSNNMALETLAMVATKTDSPAAAGAEITLAVQKMVPNVGWGGFRLLNASGLTDQARMSPGQCAALTAYAATANFQGLAFRDLLRGRKLDPFMADDPQTSAVLRTKTGTIFYARALAGIMLPQSASPVAFCVMVNNQKKRTVYDAIPFEERSNPDIKGPAKDWTRTAKAYEESLVLDWALKY